MRRSLFFLTITLALVASIATAVPMMFVSMRDAQEALSRQARTYATGILFVAQATSAHQAHMEEDMGITPSPSDPTVALERSQLWQSFMPWLEQQSTVDLFVEIITPEGRVLTYSLGHELQPESRIQATRSLDGFEVLVDLPDQILDKQLQQLLLISLGVSVLAVVLVVGWARLRMRRIDKALNALVAAADPLRQTRKVSQTTTGFPEIDEVLSRIDSSLATTDAMVERERQLSAEISHQLRTPLTALSLRLQEIEEGTELKTMQEEAAAGLVQVDRLTGVIDDLLAFQRQGAADPDGLVNIGNMLQALHDEWQPLFAARSRTLSLHCDPDLRSFGSQARQAQIVATLIENSYEHGAGETSVVVRELSRAWLSVDVGDEGEGVPVELIPNLFDRGVTGADSRSGIGLWLARALAAAENGRVELARARPPVFAVILPTRPPQGTPSGDNSRTGKASPR